MTDPGKLTHKRRRSPLSKHLASDISNVTSGVSSNPRAASSRLGMTVTDIGQHADTSHEDGDNVSMSSVHLCVCVCVCVGVIRKRIIYMQAI